MGSGGVAHLLVRQSEGGGNGDVVVGDKREAKPSVLALGHGGPPEWGEQPLTLTLDPVVEDWGGGADTKGGARVIRASSLSPSNCFPLVFFLEPDVEDWCSYISLFPTKENVGTVFPFIKTRLHVYTAATNLISTALKTSWWCGPHCSWNRRSRVCSGKFWVSRPPHVSINTIIRSSSDIITQVSIL